MTDTGTVYTVLRIGDSGTAVVDVHSRLAMLGLTELDAPCPDLFDESLDAAVRQFQQDRGLLVDGVVGPLTYRALEEARWQLGDRLLVHVPGNLLAGDDVLTLQRRLLELGFQVGRIDGRFGTKTEQAVREFQRNTGITADGTCGPATLKALARLAPLVSGGSPNAMRADDRIRRAGPQLTGKVVVIDPVTSRVASPSLRQLADEITYDLAKRIEGRLVATGVQAFLTQPAPAESAGAPPPEAPVPEALEPEALEPGVPDDLTPPGSPVDEEVARAEFANRTDAHLAVSLRLDASDNPDACGVSTYYYGIESQGVRSSIGERFAGLVQREIVARTDLADLRIHARSWDVLRRTRMPAVVIDVGYVTNGGDLARLSDAAFRDVIAEAIVVAVQRIYLAPEVDPHTGVLRLSEIREQIRREL
ncbi:MAG: peptidoglycan-binding protein [Nocardioidaceae bacterium]